MKRKVIAFLILFMFIFNICAVSAFANNDSSSEQVSTETTSLDESNTDDENTTIEVEIDNGEGPAQVIIIDVDPGTTPDETFYSIKRLFEKVHLFLTFSAEDKAVLLTEFAEKRLAEAQAMDDAGKLELVKDMVEEYAAALLNAKEKAEELVIDGLSIQEVIKQIEKLLDDNIEVLNKVKSELPELEQNLNSIKESLIVIKTISETIDQLEEDTGVDEEEENTISLNGLTIEEQVKALRDAGYGYGEISLALTMAEKADVSIDDIVEMRNSGLGWGNVTKELGMHKRDIAKKIGKMVLDSKKALLEVEEVKEDEGNKDSEKIDEEKPDLKDAIEEDENEVAEEKTVVVKELLKKEIKNRIQEIKREHGKAEIELTKEVQKKKEELKREAELKEAEIKREVMKKEIEMKKEMVKNQGEKIKENMKEDKKGQDEKGKLKKGNNNDVD
ncbi:MAG: hypothetical protein VR72_08985 [Clostridiaceae bacterium BRH_c20a]|nr:MAG: hypothetical protein VR72_08985 [Clostridiaceae bacterium BRH_c20a]